jgi:hypothetical protein
LITLSEYAYHKYHEVHFNPLCKVLDLIHEIRKLKNKSDLKEKYFLLRLLEEQRLSLELMLRYTLPTYKNITADLNTTHKLEFNAAEYLKQLQSEMTEQKEMTVIQCDGHIPDVAEWNEARRLTLEHSDNQAMPSELPMAYEASSDDAIHAKLKPTETI